MCFNNVGRRGCCSCFFRWRTARGRSISRRSSFHCTAFAPNLPQVAARRPPTPQRHSSFHRIVDCVQCCTWCRCHLPLALACCLRRRIEAFLALGTVDAFVAHSFAYSDSPRSASTAIQPGPLLVCRGLPKTSNAPFWSCNFCCVLCVKTCVLCHSHNSSASNSSDSSQS